MNTRGEIAHGLDEAAVKAAYESREGLLWVDMSETTGLFQGTFVMGKGKNWRFNHSVLYLQFLAGRQQYACTPWGTPRRNIFGWQRPCYLINDGYTDSFRELMTTTNWDRYGTGKDPRCSNCMVHCGFEPTAVMDSIKKPFKALRIYLKYFATTRPGFPKFSY